MLPPSTEGCARQSSHRGALGGWREARPLGPTPRSPAPPFPGCGWINVPTPESCRYSFQGDGPLPKLSGPQHESPHQHNRDTPAAQEVPGDGTAGQEPRTGAGVLHRPAVPGDPRGRRSWEPPAAARARVSFAAASARAPSRCVRLPRPGRKTFCDGRAAGRPAPPTRSWDLSPEPPPRRRLLPAAGPRTRDAFVPHGLLATRPVPTARAQGLVFLSNAHISVG